MCLHTLYPNCKSSNGISMIVTVDFSIFRLITCFGKHKQKITKILFDRVSITELKTSSLQA